MMLHHSLTVSSRYSQFDKEESGLTGGRTDLTTPAPSAMYNGSDFTWRGVESNDFSTEIVAGDEQESPSTTLSRLHTIDTPGEHALAKHDLGSMQSDGGPINGENVNKTGVKVRPRPPPIRVPGA
jgi:hypothetical protein